jgi:hypothetical protein
MMPVSKHAVEVDGHRFATGFRSFTQPLVIHLDDREDVCLLPWTYRENVKAMQECSQAQGGRLRLDVAQFARCVLAHSQIASDLHDHLAPLALWWAAGGEPTAAGSGLAETAGWILCGARRARLRAWSEGERLRALSAAIVERPGQEMWFDPFAYLDAMVQASVVELDPAGELGEFDAASAAALLNAVVAMNVSDTVPDADPGEGPAAREAAKGTLSLCRALGWTPSQVWAMPAPEVNRLLRLIALSEQPSAAPAARRGGRLADHPDAVVIAFE